ncbi:MAG: potassium-transporting ATPase subunit KdpB [Verrucomicrobiia bacterium]
MTHKPPSLFDWNIVGPAIVDSFRKLDPRLMIKNPVMFVTQIGALLTTLAVFTAAGERGFIAHLAVWLWFTVLFANFAEAVAEGRGKAQAQALRRTCVKTLAHRVASGSRIEEVNANDLRKGDIVVVRAGEVIPADGDVIEGAATVDESAITGESAPVIRESGGDRSAVTGGTRVLSDKIKVRVSINPGEGFLDRMISLVEGAKRQKTPNEIALTILLSALTLIFLLVCVTLKPFGIYSNAAFSVPVLIALLVCLIPTTIGGLLSAIGIAGMDRLLQHNVLAMSGRAVEAAGDVDVLLLDKTGTITLGNRQATEFVPAPGVSEKELADAAQLASLADETPEGRSVVVLAKKFGIRERQIHELPHAQFVKFTAQTRMSGVNLNGVQYRKGAADAIRGFVKTPVPAAVEDRVQRVSRGGGTPLLVATPDRVLGLIHLKDIVKGGLRERFKRLRTMGIKTIMITGDNPLTATAIAAEAGVDDFLAEAKPEDKLALIRREQSGGRMIAMIGDGTNDAPALAQADVGVAMNTGTQAAKEAGNMVDLDSNPTKLIEIIEIGKQLLITRGSLTTFSIANDVAKYFAIIPAMLMGTFPAIAPLNIMALHSPTSAILSAVIFNALIIVALIPLALRGVKFNPIGAVAILQRNLLIYGAGGVLIPFVGIKLIDMLLTALNLV